MTSKEPDILGTLDEIIAKSARSRGLPDPARAWDGDAWTWTCSGEADRLHWQVVVSMGHHVDSLVSVDAVAWDPVSRADRNWRRKYGSFPPAAILLELRLRFGAILEAAWHDARAASDSMDQRATDLAEARESFRA